MFSEDLCFIESNLLFKKWIEETIAQQTKLSFDKVDREQTFQKFSEPSGEEGTKERRRQHEEHI